MIPHKPSFFRSKAGCFPLWLLAIVAAFLCAITGFFAIGVGASSLPISHDTASAPTQAPTQAPTRVPTIAPTRAIPTPTDTPTPTPKPTQATRPTQAPEEARLGAHIDAFVAQYGKPISTSYPLYSFNNGLSATLAGTDLPRVEIVSQGAPNDHNFSLQEAKAACLGFLPRDAVDLHKHVTRYYSDGTLYGEIYVYHSDAMEKLFPASLFTDQDGNPTTKGTVAFTAAYPTGETNGFVDCDVQIGMY